ncbi:MAG: hypothetical protein P8176_08645 [Gammaproteobacteria bacterium]
MVFVAESNFMPSKKSDKSSLASVEALNAAFDIQAGVTDVAFNELYRNLSSIPERLAALVQKADVVYPGHAGSLSRMDGGGSHGSNMRENGAFKLKPNKVGSPNSGRLSF